MAAPVSPIHRSRSTNRGPTITVDGDLKLCEGESVTLICSAAPGYSWTNGSTEQSVLVTEPGTYSVSIDGECAEPTASEDVVVEVFDVPGTPTVEDSELAEAASTTLEFAGTELHWYESETADAPLFVGNSFTTDVLTETTTFWVEDVLNHGLETAMGGCPHKATANTTTTATTGSASTPTRTS